MKIWTKLRERLRAYDDAHNFTCDICGREVFGGERVCEGCFRALEWNDKTVCPFCGRRVKEPGACLDCKEKPLSVRKARSVCVHEGEAARLVVRFKRGAKYLYRTLAELSVPLADREFPEVDMLVGVPMSEKAQKKRGYNQSALFAERLAELLQKTYAQPVSKPRETASQKFLGRREREKNLEGCFHVDDRKAVKGKKILIVDDTLTTGATVSELASALKRAGAADVTALTFTSVEKKHPFGVK